MPGVVFRAIRAHGARYIYSSFGSQIVAPTVIQVPIRSGSVGVGFSTFGVHGYTTTQFNNRPSSGNNFYCGACYRNGR